jgi:hypothetical protein
MGVAEGASVAGAPPLAGLVAGAGPRWMGLLPGSLSTLASLSWLSLFRREGEFSMWQDFCSASVTISNTGQFDVTPENPTSDGLESGPQTSMAF